MKYLITIIYLVGVVLSWKMALEAIKTKASWPSIVAGAYDCVALVAILALISTGE